LEDRRLLSAWTNPNRALDVNNDGFVSPVDAIIVINRLTAGQGGPLPAVDDTHKPPPYYDTNADGILSALDAITIINRLNAAQGGIQLQAALSNDTGLSNQDRITQDASIRGQLTASEALRSKISFQLSIDSGPSTNDLLPLVQPDGSFIISHAQLDQFAGGLADGNHTFRLVAREDEFGYRASVSVSIILDRAVQTPSRPDLLPESDSGDDNTDNITNVTSPKFQVMAEPGSRVTLWVNGQAAAAGPANQPLTIPDLPEGSYQVTASIVDVAGNESAVSPSLTVQIVTTPPTVILDTLPFTQDLTPNFRISASGPVALPNGTAFHIDVDLNNDGIFSEDELDNTVATLFAGSQEMGLAKALPRADLVPYVINVRARVRDSVGNVGYSDVRTILVSTLTTDTLKNYVQRDDGAFAWTLVSTIQRPAYTVYVLDMKSQRWRTPEDFTADETLWQHYVTLIVPTGPVAQTALLHITGGDKDTGPPTAADFASGKPLDVLAQEAVATRSIAVNLPNVPREPVTFAGDESENPVRSEDRIIAYTFDQFLKNPTLDTQWPLLLPMVKSAVKAMDAVQAFLPTVAPTTHVQDFVVTGASKRGWTTWLTAAVDDRVRAIVPIVFDALNLGEQMVHHYGVYGFFSFAIAPYGEMNVFERILTLQGQLLGKVVDPYTYLNNGRFNIPKLIVNSTGDQFFVSDSAQYYFHDLPGDNNYILYVPNSGHGLDATQGMGSVAVQGIAAFYNAIIHGLPLPQFSWKVLDDGTIRVQTVTQPLEVKLWQATNPDARDFRLTIDKEGTPSGITWTSTPLTSQGGGVYLGNVATPATGARGYYVELTFASPLPFPYRFTTELRVKTNLPLHEWPFPVGTLGDAQVPRMQTTNLDGGFDAALEEGPSIAAAAFAVNAAPPVSFNLATATVEEHLWFAPLDASRNQLEISQPADGESARSLLEGTSSGSYHDPSRQNLLDAALDAVLDDLLAIPGV
jgi:PhoPQ-activated pathogenicity-related protein